MSSHQPQHVKTIYYNFGSSPVNNEEVSRQDFDEVMNQPINKSVTSKPVTTNELKINPVYQQAIDASFNIEHQKEDNKIINTNTIIQEGGRKPNSEIDHDNDDHDNDDYGSDDDDNSSQSSKSSNCSLHTEDLFKLDPMYFRLTKFLEHDGENISKIFIGVKDELKNIVAELKILNEKKK